MYRIDGIYMKEKLIENYDLDFNIVRNYNLELKNCGITDDQIQNSMDITNTKFKNYYKNKEQSSVSTESIVYNNIITESDINYFENNNITQCVKKKLNTYLDELKSGYVINKSTPIKKEFSGSKYIDIKYFIIDGLNENAYINNLILSQGTKNYKFFPYEIDHEFKLENDNKIYAYKLYKDINLQKEFDDSILYHKTLINVGSGNSLITRTKHSETMEGRWKQTILSNTNVENKSSYMKIDNKDNIWYYDETPRDSEGNVIDFNRNITINIEENALYTRVTDKVSLEDRVWDDNIYIYISCTQPLYDLVVSTIYGDGIRHKNINDGMYIEILNNSRIKFSLRDNSIFNIESFDLHYPVDCYDNCYPIITITTDKSNNYFIFDESISPSPATSNYEYSKIEIDTDRVVINENTLNEVDLNIYNTKGKSITDVDTKIKIDDVEVQPTWFKSNGSKIKFSNASYPQFTLDVTAKDEDYNKVHKRIPLYIKFSNFNYLLPQILTESITINYNEKTEVYIQLDNFNGNDNIIIIYSEILKDREVINPYWFKSDSRIIEFNHPVPEYDEFYDLLKYEIRITVENKIGKVRKKIIPLIMNFDNKEFIFDNLNKDNLNPAFPDYIPQYEDMLNDTMKKYQSLDDKRKLHFYKRPIFTPIENITIDIENFDRYKKKLKELNSGDFYSKTIEKIKRLGLNSKVVADNPIKMIIPITVELDNKMFKTFSIPNEFIENLDLDNKMTFDNFVREIYKNYLNIDDKSKLHLDDTSDITLPIESISLDSNFKDFNVAIESFDKERLFDLIESKKLESTPEEVKLLLPVTFDK